LAKVLIPDSERRQSKFVQMLDSPRRVVMCITPEKFITFSSEKMQQYWRGGGEPE